MDKIDRNDLKALMKLKGYPFMEDIVINKVNEIVDFINGLSDVASNSNLYKEKR